MICAATLKADQNKSSCSEQWQLWVSLLRKKLRNLQDCVVVRFADVVIVWQGALEKRVYVQGLG